MVFSFNFCFSQNQIENTYEAKVIDEITIDGNQIFNIDISASSSEKIKISSLLDGEYQNNFFVSSKEENNVLYIALQKSSLEGIPDDKRNAHKVVAASLIIELPTNKSISIKSDIGSVKLNGHFKSISISLDEGSFQGRATAKEGMVQSISGNIYLETIDANIKSKTRNGVINLSKNLKGKHIWNLITVDGNITVKPLNKPL